MNHAITCARESHFTWEVTADNKIYFESTDSTNQGNFTQDQLMTCLTWLFQRFGHETFPLANKVDDVPSGDVEDGLGLALHDVGYSQSAHASFLGSIMTQIGIFEYDTASPRTEWKFPDNITTTQINDVIEIAGNYDG